MRDSRFLPETGVTSSGGLKDLKNSSVGLGGGLFHLRTGGHGGEMRIRFIPLSTCLPTYILTANENGEGPADFMLDIKRGSEGFEYYRLESWKHFQDSPVGFHEKLLLETPQLSGGYLLNFLDLLSIEHVNMAVSPCRRSMWGRYLLANKKA